MPRRRTNTGNPTPYSGADEAALEAAAENAWQQWDASEAAERGLEPTTMQISAQIEWSGSVDLANDGHRSTRLYGLQLREFQQVTERARAARERAEAARPATSYRAKGWQAQLRQLGRVKRGQAAAQRAGLAPSQRTMREWLTGRRQPNKENRDRIARAYDELRNWRVNNAQDAAARANKEVADQLNEAFRDSQQAEIRLRNITRMDLES